MTLKTKTSSACGQVFTKGLPLSPWLIPTVAQFSMWSPIQVLYCSNVALLPGTKKMRWVHPGMEKGQNRAVFNQWKSCHHPYRQSGPRVSLSFLRVGHSTATDWQAQHQGGRLDGIKLSTRRVISHSFLFLFLIYERPVITFCIP